MKRGSFYTDQWMKELGLSQKHEWPEDQIKLGPLLLVRSPDFSAIISKEMCHQKGLVTTGYAWRECKEWGHIPRILIDRYTLKRDGTYQLWVTPNHIEIKSVRKSQGQRPWSQHDRLGSVHLIKRSRLNGCHPGT